MEYDPPKNPEQDAANTAAMMQRQAIRNVKPHARADLNETSMMWQMFAYLQSHQVWLGPVPSCMAAVIPRLQSALHVV